ncbi:hypothetical protein CCR75_006678 [Bremia lactucae]|uniref:Borealin N-terminal domain-containing protein n=1 Tax=Bremia lactucae TaxID=4779 RepID=A0A976NYS1_BRELC|nr:hypothetical protein CCR75_006678 [Bremia lactucae]
MAPSGRLRHRRAPRRRGNFDGQTSTRSTNGVGPLQAIGENTVVNLSSDVAIAGSSSFTLPSTTLLARSPKKQRKNTNRKKRPHDGSIAFQFVKTRKDQLETLLDELETQVQEKCEELIAGAERRAQELEMELKVQLLFLPEAVRKMPWKIFVEDFGGDLQNVIKSLSQSQGFASLHPSPSRMRSAPTKFDIVASTPSSMNYLNEGDYDYESELSKKDFDTWRRRISAFSTPMDRCRVSAVPSTVLRTARKGETIYSVRGSPIVPESVDKAKAPTGSLVATFENSLDPTSCCIKLDTERVLDLSRPQDLSAKSRGEATSKLKALQAKVAQLLLQINHCS